MRRLSLPGKYVVLTENGGRVAVSGKPTTPGGAVELCQILGKEETLRRIQQGIQQLTPQA